MDDLDAPLDPPHGEPAAPAGEFASAGTPPDPADALPPVDVPAPTATRPSARRWQRLWPLGVLAFGAAIAWLLWSTAPQAQRRKEPPRKVEVEVAAVHATRHQVVIQSQGTVRARYAGAVSALVAGQVVEVAPDFTDGGLVEEGALLVKLESREYQLAVEELEQQLAAAAAELEEVAVELKNLADLLRLAAERVTFREAQLARVVGQREQGIATEDELLAAQVAELEAREAQFGFQHQQRSLQARRTTLVGSREVVARRLARARLDLERTEIRAPYTARVVERSVSPGVFLARGATVGLLYAVGELEVRLPLTAEQLSFLDLTQATPVTLTARIGTRRLEWQATLSGAEGRVDPSSRQLAAIARISAEVSAEAGSELRPGTFVSARLQGRALEGVIEIPRAAALAGDEVLVADREAGVVRRRAIEVARKTVDHLVVTSGLEDGELICTTPLVFAGEQLEVTIRDAVAPKAPE